jgi:hypothetical protein
MRTKLFISFLFVLGGQTLWGQIKLGQWRTHLPYRYCTRVETTEDRIYCSATGGLFSYNLNDNSIEKLSKIDGLSDNGVSALRWEKTTGTLVLAYQNANLDIIREGTVINLPDIMKKQIPGDKSIYDIFFLDRTAYLSTGFGIVLINLQKNEFMETYFIGDNGDALKVNQVTSDGTYIYAATDEGIRRGLLSDPFLVDFNSWEKLGNIPNAGGAFTSIAYFNGVLFTSWRDPGEEQDQVYYGSWDSWDSYPYFSGTRCNEIRNQGEYLTLASKAIVHLVSKDMLIIRELYTGNSRSASLDPAGALWVADFGGGLITDQGGSRWSIIPNGPSSPLVHDLAAAGDLIYSIQGGVSGSWNNQFTQATIQRFSEQQWDFQSFPEMRDLISLAIDPADPDHVFAGSWGYGLLEYRKEQEPVRYTELNSTLRSIIPGGAFIRIGGIVFDDQGNLWMTNSAVENPISVLKNDGSWKSFRAGNLITEYHALGKILVTESGHKWVIVPRANGLFAMDDAGTIDDASDDDYRKVNVVDRNGKLITNDVRSFTEDHNGNLWLGTNQGVLVIYSPWRLFSEGSIYAQEILIPRNDGTIYADPLLGSQVVTAIEVDGANRKWLGTAGGGVYLVSDDGQEQIRQFNASNSPLLSNNITDICIDGVTGEVFIGTDRGLISYRGDALTGSPHYNQVVVFPNPVRETYHGPVVIKGLVAETTVKITDMGGNLVYETESLGGQAIWDGKNFRGERVATGVYMIYLSSEDGSLSHVTKLLFIH